MRLALALLCALATLGEGGGSAGGLLGWHAGLLLLLLCALLGPRGTGRPAAAPAAAFGLFLALAALGAARAPDGYEAWLQCLELACWTTAAWLAARSGPGPGLLATLAPVLAVAAGLQGGLAVVHVLGGGPGRPAGTFLNPNHMALWLVAAVLLAAGAALDGAGRARRLTLALALPPALAGIALAGSRGALLGLIAGGAWLAADRWRSAPRRWRAAALAVAALLLLGLGIKLAERARRADPFRYQRVRIWQASLGLALEQPLWGSGPGQFPAAAANRQFPDGDGPLRYDRRFSATHSDPIRVPVELGLPAALALLAALALAVRAVRRSRRVTSASSTAVGASAALVAFGTHALVDNPSSWPSVYLLAAVLTGAVLCRPAAPATPRSGPLWRAAAAAVALGVFAIGDVAPYLAWRQAAGLPAGRLDERGAARLQRAAALNRLHPGYKLRLADHLVAGPDGWTLDEYAAAREWAEAAVRDDPAAAETWRGLARVEGRVCREWQPSERCRERTRELYRRAEDRARFDPFLPIELAKFLLDSGDPVGARRPAERALALEPEAALPRLLLADAALHSGGEGSIASARRLIAEAREKSERWSEWSGSPYGRSLLTVEPRVTRRLESALAAAEAAGGRGAR